MSVITNDDGKINDLFIRLNTSKALTGAEIRNAMSGPVSDSIRQICRHNFFDKKIKFQTKRGQDQNAAAKILLLEFRGKLVDTKKVHLDRFVKEGIKSNSIDIEHAKHRVFEVLDRMSMIFNDRDRLLSSQGVVTVYYWFIRSIDGSESKIYSFLVWFVSELKRQKGLPIGEQDNLLLNYQLFSRSTNDQGSLLNRFKILMTYYDRC